MNASKKFPLKFLYLIIITSSIIVVVASVEVLAKARNIDFYNSYVKVLKERGVLSSTFQSYLTYMLGMYFARIAVPIGLSLNSFYAYRKDLLTKVFVGGWTIFLIGALLFSALTLEFGSTYYYIFLVLFLVLIGIVGSMITVFNERPDRNRKNDESSKSKESRLKEKNGGVKR